MGKGGEGGGGRSVWRTREGIKNRQARDDRVRLDQQRGAPLRHNWGGGGLKG